MKPISFEDTGICHRSPLAFSQHWVSPSPRQDKNGQRFKTWGEAITKCTDIVFDVDRESVQRLLPEGYEVDPEVQPTVLFDAMHLRKLPWLNGRGYNTFGIYVNDVICHRATEGPVRGSYLLVLFENFTDPILTGREELGFPKIWAELPDVLMEDDKLVLTASWFGHEFMRLEIPQLADKPIEEAPSQKKREFGHPSVDGILQHRYIPMVGFPGKHDASYAIHAPGGGDNKPKLLKYATTTGNLENCKISYGSSSWEELPTLWNVVEGLKSLKLGKVREVSVQHIQGGSDLAGCKRVEW